jgi:hypothetical protein
MPNRTEARPAKAELTNATGRLPLLRLFSTPLTTLGHTFQRHTGAPGDPVGRGKKGGVLFKIAT